MLYFFFIHLKRVKNKAFLEMEERCKKVGNLRNTFQKKKTKN